MNDSWAYSFFGVGWRSFTSGVGRLSCLFFGFWLRYWAGHELTLVSLVKIGAAFF